MICAVSFAHPLHFYQPIPIPEYLLDPTTHRRRNPRTRHHHLRALLEPPEPLRGRRARRRLQHLAPLRRPGPVLGAAAGRGLVCDGVG